MNLESIFRKARYAFNEIFQCTPRRLLGVKYGKIPGEILIINFMGIGNVILFTPVLQTLRKKYPTSKITVILAKRGTKDVIDSSGLVDEIIEHDIRGEGGVNKFLAMAESMSNRKIDVGITFYRSHRSARFLFESCVSYSVGFKYPFRQFTSVGFLLGSAVKLDLERHEVDHNLDLLRAIGVSDEELVIDPTFYFGRHDLKSAREKLAGAKIDIGRPMIGFHTGAYKDLIKKVWPAEYFSALGDMLVDRYDARILIVGGPEERKYVDAIVSRMKAKKKSHNLAGVLTLKETAALISEMDIFISNDSGPMHIAAGVGTPVIGIFGPTSDAKNAPWPKKGVPAEVIRYEMDCAPCYVPYSARIDCNHMTCMKKLTPQMVFDRCLEILRV